MKLNRITLSLGLLFTAMVQAQEYKPLSKEEIASRAEDLLSKMTIEEKVGQMTQVTLDVIGEGDNIYSSFEPFNLDKAALKKALSEYKVGSFLNTANNRALTTEHWYRIINQIQQTNIEETKLDIPIIYGVDEIHWATYTVGAT